MARPPKFEDDDVLDRATDLFWRRGVDAVSIRDLEATLDLRAPSIYRRFHSKDELIARCLDHYVERDVRARIRRFLLGSDDPVAGLRAFFVSALVAHPGEWGSRGCLLTTTAGRGEASAAAVRAALERGFDAIESAFRDQVMRLVAARRLSADTDVAAVAKALMISFQGLLVLARVGAPDLESGIDAALGSLIGRTDP